MAEDDWFYSLKASVQESVERDRYIYANGFAADLFETSETRFSMVVGYLKRGGYNVHYLHVSKPAEKNGTTKNVVRVLAKSDVRYHEVWENRDKIVDVFCARWINGWAGMNS